MCVRRVRDILGCLGAGLLTGTLLSAYNLWTRANADPLHSVLEGDGRYYPWREGRIFYKVHGDGQPMLLLHGVYQGASGREMRKQHTFFAENGFKVYTPDLLGYGLSTRPPIRYTHELFTQQIHDFLRDVIGTSAVVVAGSFAAGFSVAAAARNPERFAALVLIEPVGVERSARRPIWGRPVEELIRAPGVGDTLYNLLVSRPALTWYAIRQLYHDDEHVTDDLLDYQYAMSHQPNARFATAAYLGGALNRSIRDAFAALRVPTFLAWGYQSTNVPPTDGPAFLRVNPRVTLAGFDAKSLPHDEAADEFNTQVLRWLRRQAEKPEHDDIELRVVM